MQIVGYYRETADRSAALLTADEGSVAVVPLDSGAELAYTLGVRRCAGAIDGDRHYPCQKGDAPYCPVHQETWVCARCTGTCLKDEMDCYDEHAVYLAAFAPSTFKVGVTRFERLETRFREQGADRGAHIHTVSNGRIAREIEAELATEIGDSVRTDTKVASLDRSVDEDAWERLLAGHDVIDTFAFDYGLELNEQPISETIAAGTVRGTKGRVLVLDRSGGTFAVDLRDLVGHELFAGSPDRELQSTLGTFGD